MEYKNIASKIKEQEESKFINSNAQIKNLKSDYFIRKLFDHLHKRKSLDIIKYNKNIQKRINIDINNYKDYSEKYSSIEIEIIPMKNEYGKFIYIKKGDEKYYHIYFNDNKKKEIKRTYFEKNDEVTKINIIIDYQIISLQSLFSECKCIEFMNFKKFYRNNIINMYDMFYNCSSLKELNLNNFNTNNVTNMRWMFSGCSSLKKLNLYVQRLLVFGRIKSR